MRVTLISACEKRAIKRSFAVLDSYAIRIGPRTWSTAITLEGLQELRLQLRSRATRQTSVACYREERFQRLHLLWVVGSRTPFGQDGHYPAGHMRRKTPPPPWLAMVGLLVQASGLSHDLGKFGSYFADKLARAVEQPGIHGDADPVRHEWISMRLLQLLRDPTLDAAAAWQKLTRSKTMRDTAALDAGVVDPLSALDYLVATHHRLFGPFKDISTPTADAHVTERYSRDYGIANSLKSMGEVPEDIRAGFHRTLRRLTRETIQHEPPSYWRAVAIFARAALILADHEISSRESPDNALGCKLFANTEEIKDENHRGIGRYRYNQPLDWHLKKVSQRGVDLAWRIATLRLPGLSGESEDRISQPSPEESRFAWQNRAVAALQSAREHYGSGLLVLNIAATGAGKTIANAKLACAASPGRARFAVALNLRTLALQTGDAYSDGLSLGYGELATVIGDRQAVKLHQAAHDATAAADTTGTSDAFQITGEPTTDYVVRGEGFDLPDWMRILTERQSSTAQIIAAPVLVSTIDYLINAGEPGRQGHHVSALMRMIDSDLVLDEVDSYDPGALVAVLRLIQVVGLMGRTLICSSATLPVPVARSIFAAYRSGAAMRAALEKRQPAFGIVIIDDQCTPSIHSSDETFEASYRKHLDLLLSASRKRWRWARIQPVDRGGFTAFATAIRQAAQTLHDDNAWSGPHSARISFGLVRVANISTAIAVARFLSTEIPAARVCCYHAQLFRIERHKKERRLDLLLSRKHGDSHILADEEIIQQVALANADSVPFIVVATPVEEIGRDHDFDWAVIEPSSAHSIVQAAGRVNRHRLIVTSHPNIVILQRNLRSAEDAADSNACFFHPGLESCSHEYRYCSHDLAELLEEANLARLDARLRLGSNLMSKEEDRILDARLKTPLAILEADDSYPSEWMTQAFYSRYSLRDSQISETWRCCAVDPEPSFCRMQADRTGTQWLARDVRNIEPVQNAWLCWDIQELVADCAAHELPPEDGLEFQVRRLGDEKELVWDRSFGFHTATRR